MKCFCEEKRKTRKTMTTTTMNEEVMRGLMEILVRRMSVVFGREEKEVREAIEEEMTSLSRAYMTWVSVMSQGAQKEEVKEAKKEPKAKKMTKKEQEAAKAAEAEATKETETETPKETPKEVEATPAPPAPPAPKATKATKAPKEKVEKVVKEKAPKAKKAAGGKAKAEPKPEVKEPEPEATAEDEEVEVVEMEYKGVKYLKAASGVVYDAETSEEVGRWNEETCSIEVE